MRLMQLLLDVQNNKLREKILIINNKYRYPN